MGGRVLLNHDCGFTTCNRQHCVCKSLQLHFVSRTVIVTSGLPGTIVQGPSSGIVLLLGASVHSRSMVV